MTGLSTRTGETHKSNMALTVELIVKMTSGIRKNIDSKKDEK